MKFGRKTEITMISLDRVSKLSCVYFMYLETCFGWGELISKSRLSVF